MIYSMFAMMLLTLCIALYLLKLRVDAVKKREVTLSAFRLYNSTGFPVKMQQVARNYSNLFEMPVLFYCAAILTLVLHVDTPAMIFLSWAFVVSRAAHSWIHITSNNVIRRLQAFMAATICVFLMWVILLWQYTAQAIR